jgi:hypothetical protein
MTLALVINLTGLWKILSELHLLYEPLKDFIVNPADLPWKWLKRLAASGERVNYGSW